MDLAKWPLRTSHRNSPQGLNISSIRVFDQTKDPAIPISHRPHIYYVYIIIRRRGVVGRVPAFQPGGPGSVLAGSGILISVLGLGVCPLSVFCPVLSSAEALKKKYI